ncbi:MAG: NAD(P)H-dependent oxidoreductase [Chlamydiota bacterium]|nr:NAD(P)H-dependent oxidoreductase [Chlamydiota bacterium]
MFNEDRQYALCQRDLIKEAAKKDTRKRRPRIALVRGSLGGKDSLSNASANAYAQALKDEGFDIDEINLSEVPFADEWDSKYKDKQRALLRESDATVFATPVYNWGPSARVNAYLQNAVKAGQDPYRPYTVLGAAGSQRSQGYLTSLQNSLAMEDKGINVGAPLLATEEDMEYDGETLKGVSASYRKRLKEHAGVLASLARNRRSRARDK